MANFWNYKMGWNAAPFFPKAFGWLFVLVLLDLILRGIALWRSARKEQIWFIALLLVNSLGILPGVYLLLNGDQKPPREKRSER